MSGEELELVRSAFGTNYIAPLGPMVDAFEREFAAYVGIPHCLALSSGTSAMHLAMKEFGVGPGDVVLASTLTFIGSVSPAIHLGASLAFIDADPATWNMDLGLLQDELVDRVKAGKPPKLVVPTDLYGQCSELDRIRAVCQLHGIPVVADSAEAMGASYYETMSTRPGCGQDGDRLLRHAGFGADAAVYSFNGNKIITTSGGGMLASHNDKLIDHARKISQQARDPAPHYQHSEIGYNYRMSNILAAIGRGQLNVLSQRAERKREIFGIYKRLLGDLPGVEFMPESPGGRCNRWLTVLLLDREVFGAGNDDVRLKLESENIESRPVWKPMHLQPVFARCRVRGGAVSEHLF